MGPKGVVSAARPVRRLLGFQSKGRDQHSLVGGACGLGDFINLTNPGLPVRSLSPVRSQRGPYVRVNLSQTARGPQDPCSTYV